MNKIRKYLLAGAAIAAVAILVLATRSQPAVKAAGPVPAYIPIGASTVNNNTSIAWFIDPNKNQIVACSAIAPNSGTITTTPAITKCATTLYEGPPTPAAPVSVH